VDSLEITQLQRVRKERQTKVSSVRRAITIGLRLI
jgi:hypothetical protein